MTGTIVCVKCGLHVITDVCGLVGWHLEPEGNYCPKHVRRRSRLKSLLSKSKPKRCLRCGAGAEWIE